MEFRILGALEVLDEGRAVALGGSKQRALLALLLVHANETLTTDRLIDELWGEHPPAAAAKTVQVHISRLRKTLTVGNGAAANEVVATREHGYELTLDPERLDAHRFERLVGDGANELAAGRPERALPMLEEALALWRGPPLADLSYERFAQPEIARLEDLRIAALEQLIEAKLALGRHAEVVRRLQTLIGEHPYREHLRAQLMLALYRSDRQADALQAYQDTRRTLVEELGIEPGERLRELERAILEQDPALALPVAAVSAPERPREAFVGRERELAELVGGLDDAIAGRGRLFLLAGEPGIGKSRLAEELIAQARARGARALVGRCWEAGGAPAYWPWLQSLRPYVRDTDADSLRSQLREGALEVAQLLPELREFLADLPPPPSLESEGARFRLFDSMTAFLKRAAAARPLVLVLDDLHAADEPSLLLLRFVARELGESRLLIVGAYRDVDPTVADPLSTTLTEMAREPVTRTLALVGLGEADVARFIEIAAPGASAAELGPAVHAETEGNPLFVDEIVRLLAAEGRLDEPVTAPLAIPQSVREVIGRRLRLLSDECNRLLTLASVLGREFDLDALASVSGLERRAILELLDEAIAARVVSEVPGAIGRVRFVHTLVRDAAYHDLSISRRVRLQRQVGEALEALYSDDLEPHLAELAHHFYEAVPAGDADKAMHYARRAGDRAATLLAYEEAARLYAIGARTIESHAAGDERDRCELLLRLGDVQARAGDMACAKETFLRAAEVARAAALPEDLARAALRYGGRFVWSRAWGDRHLVPLLEEALSTLRDEDSELRVRLLARLAGGPLRDTLPPGPREAMSQKAVDMARRLGDPATLAYALDGRHCANWGPEALSTRLRIADELIRVAEHACDLERAYEGHDFRFWALLEAGDVRAARVQNESKIRLAHELRQPAQRWDVMANRANLALFEGRLVDAEAAIHEALAQGRLVQSANAQMAFDLQMYALRREQGRLEAVLEVVERAVDKYPAYPVWRYVLADVYAELGRRDDARAALDALAMEGFPVRVEMQWLFSISLLPEVCRYLADAQRAATIYERLLPYAKRNALTPPELCRGSVSRGLGILAATMSKWDQAVQHFDDALRMNHAMGARPWLAHTRYDYAHMLLARAAPCDRETARELLTAAKALSQDLEMNALTEKVSGLSMASPSV